MQLFHFQTNQIQPFKNLIESLKEIMVETNLELSQSNIRISKMNALDSICCVVKLTAEELNQNGNVYECEYPDSKPLIVGINLIHLSKILRNVSPDNVLHLDVDELNKNCLKIRTVMTNRLVVSNYTINFTEVNVETITIPNVEFDKTIEIESKYFQRQIKDINNLDLKFIDIKAANNQMFITGNSGFITKETIKVCIPFI